MPEHPDDKAETKHPSRIKQYEQDGIEVTMPECEAMYLVSYLYEIGPTLPNGMGEAPLTHAEIESWQRNTGIQLDSWEARTIHMASLQYLSESQHATKPDAPAPWADAPYTKPAPNLVALRMQQAMQDLVNL